MKEESLETKIFEQRKRSFQERNFLMEGVLRQEEGERQKKNEYYSRLEDRKSEVERKREGERDRELSWRENVKKMSGLYRGKGSESAQREIEEKESERMAKILQERVSFNHKF